MADPPFLPDPGLVLTPELEPRGWMRRGDLLQLRPKPVFERGSLGLTALRMPWPRLLPRQPQPPEQTGHAPLAAAHPVALLGVGADVAQPPSAHPVPLRMRAAQHPSLERRPLPGRKRFRPPRTGPVVQPVHPSRVVA